MGLGLLMPDLFESTSPVPREASRIRYLVGLDVTQPSFVRLVTARIAEMVDPTEIEAALREVPAAFHTIIETMAVQAIAYRIAQLPSLAGRRAALERVPDGLRARVAPHLQSYYTTKPWLRKARDDD